MPPSSIAEASAAILALPQEVETPAAAPVAAPETKAAAPEPVATEPAKAPEAVTPAKSAADKARAAMENVLKKPEPKGKKSEIIEMPDEEFEKLRKDGKVDAAYWRRYDALRDKTKAKDAVVSGLEARIKEFESKPAPTAADDSKLKALEKQLADIQGENKTYKQKLNERDFYSTDEFKAIDAKWKKGYEKAYALTAKLQVVDELGEPQRQATNADFDKVFNAPIQTRRAVAKQLFGEDVADDIMQNVTRLWDIVDEQNEAQSGHSKNWQKVSQDRENQGRQEQENISRLQSASQKALETNHPEYFSPEHYKDAPELQKALADGYKIVDDAMAEMASMSPQDRADTTAVIRARAGGFPLLYTQLQAERAEKAALAAELAKLRGKDPGNIPDKAPPSAPAADKVGGMREMAAKYVEV